MTIKISQLGNLTTFTDTTYVVAVNTAATFTTVKSTGLVLKDYVLGDLPDQVANLESNSTTFTSNISTIESDVANLESSMTSVEGDIVAIQSDISTIEGNIASLEANAAAQAELISNLDTLDLANVEANVATLQSDVNDLESNVTILQGDVASLTDGSTTFGNVVPTANVSYDLGSPTAMWKDLYLSGNTVYLGGATLSFDGYSVTVDQPLLSLSGSQSFGITTVESLHIDQQGYGFSGNGRVAISTGALGDPWGEGALVVETNNLEGNGIVPSNPDQYTLGTIDIPWRDIYTGNLTVGTPTTLGTSTIQFPNNGAILEGNLGVYPSTFVRAPDNGTALLTASYTGNVSLNNFVELGDTANIGLYGAGDVIHNWQFDTSGLTWPDGTVQTTASPMVRPVLTDNAGNWSTLTDVDPDTYCGLNLVDPPTATALVNLLDGSYNGQTFFVVKNNSGGSQLLITMTTWDTSTNSVAVLNNMGEGNFVWQGSYWVRLP